MLPYGHPSIQNRPMAVSFLHGDITQVDAAAVVTGEGPDLAMESGVTKSLLYHLPQLKLERSRHKRQLGKEDLPFGAVLISDLTKSGVRGPRTFRYVLHAVLNQVTTSEDQWLKDMGVLYNEIFRAAYDLCILSLAVPLLGSGVDEANKLLAIQALASAVVSRRTHYPTQLIIVCDDRRLLDAVHRKFDSSQSQTGGVNNVMSFFSSMANKRKDNLKHLFAYDVANRHGHNGMDKTASSGHREQEEERQLREAMKNSMMDVQRRPPDYSYNKQGGQRPKQTKKSHSPRPVDGRNPMRHREGHNTEYASQSTESDEAIARSLQHDEITRVRKHSPPRDLRFSRRVNADGSDDDDQQRKKETDPVEDTDEGTARFRAPVLLQSTASDEGTARFGAPGLLQSTVPNEGTARFRAPGLLQSTVPNEGTARFGAPGLLQSTVPNEGTARFGAPGLLQSTVPNEGTARFGAPGLLQSTVPNEGTARFGAPVVKEENGTVVDRQMLNLLYEAFSVLERSLSEEVTPLHVSRDNIDSLLGIYASDPLLATRRIHVVFENESGSDFGGLTKEMFTIFWTSAFEKYFVGENVKIPFLPLHRSRKEMWKFKAIGLILSHSVAVTKSFPSLISSTSLNALIFQDVDEQCLLKDFMLYSTENERALLQKALHDFDSLSSREFDSLVSLYSFHGFLELPNKSEVLDQITEIARDVLVQKPRPLYEAIRSGIPQLHLSQFWNKLSINSIRSLIQLQRPSPSALAEILTAQVEPLTPDQERVMYFLTQYILGLDQDDLLEFLHFTTGSTHMPSDGIKVSFNSLHGSLRRPIAHTCSNLLELSIMYSSFQEFKQEMQIYLRSQSSFEFSIL